jgi:hypothetical protein
VPISNWWMPVAAGDVGVKALTQMQCSALMAVGAVNFVIGHPIAWMPAAIPQFVTNDFGGIMSAFNMTRIFDGACLSVIRMAGNSGGSQCGNFTTVSG